LSRRAKRNYCLKQQSRLKKLISSKKLKMKGKATKRPNNMIKLVMKNKKKCNKRKNPQ